MPRFSECKGVKAPALRQSCCNAVYSRLPRFDVGFGIPIPLPPINPRFLQRETANQVCRLDLSAQSANTTPNGLKQNNE